MAIIFIAPAYGQTWELHVAAGSSNGLLIPRSGSAHASNYIHYGFTKGGAYFSPELRFTINEHSSLSLGYRASVSSVGVRITSGERGSSREVGYDEVAFHNFSVGYTYKAPVFKGNFIIGGFAKGGIGYGELFGIGGGSKSGFGDSRSETFMYMSRLNDFEVMPSFW